MADNINNSITIIADTYHYSAIWSEEDEEYVGLCAEFPLLSWLAPDREEALESIKALVIECLEDMAENEEPLPEPTED